jgi:hypothetical protein
MSFLVGKVDSSFTLASKAGGTRFAAGLSGAVQRATVELSLILQESTLEFYDASIQREATLTGRLRDVIASSKNRFANVTGFGVGNVELMDQEALYWRNIEQGTANQTDNPNAFAREVFGFFRVPGLPSALSMRGEPIPLKADSRPTAALDGRLVQLHGPGPRAHYINIHDIRAHAFYADAWHQMFERNVIRTVMAKHLRETINPITRTPTDWVSILESAGL